MTVKMRREALLLVIGDTGVLICSLWLALFLRSGVFPSFERLVLHAPAFMLMGAVWMLVFFIFDLYGKQTLPMKRRLPRLIVRAQGLNLVLAIVFFYFIPYFFVTPKIVLFLNLIVATVLLYLWRLVVVELVPRGRREFAVILSDKPEGEELGRELSGNTKHGITLLSPSVLGTPEGARVSFVILDLSDSQYRVAFSNFYDLLTSGVRFIDIAEFYEEIFDRVPLSYVDERWFLEHISNHPKFAYDSARRLLDVVLAGFLWFLSIPLYLLVWVLVMTSDGAPLFFTQERVGKNGRVFTIHKFRSMREGRVTAVGAWMRKTRIDELPQLISVIRGDLSLIGPRPEKPDYVALYREDLPYYDARHMIAPGLSGWAQLYHENHPHFAPALEQTKEKLSYDLYYIKNRSFWLDIKITIKTLKILFLTAGI